MTRMPRSLAAAAFFLMTCPAAAQQQEDQEEKKAPQTKGAQDPCAKGPTKAGAVSKCGPGPASKQRDQAAPAGVDQEEEKRQAEEKEKKLREQYARVNQEAYGDEFDKKLGERLREMGMDLPDEAVRGLFMRNLRVTDGSFPEAIAKTYKDLGVAGHRSAGLPLGGDLSRLHPRDIWGKEGYEFVNRKLAGRTVLGQGWQPVGSDAELKARLAELDQARQNGALSNHARIVANTLSLEAQAALDRYESPTLVAPPAKPPVSGYQKQRVEQLAQRLQQAELRDAPNSLGVRPPGAAPPKAPEPLQRAFASAQKLGLKGKLNENPDGTYTFAPEPFGKTITGKPADLERHFQAAREGILTENGKKGTLEDLGDGKYLWKPNGIGRAYSGSKEEILRYLEWQRDESTRLQRQQAQRPQQQPPPRPQQAPPPPPRPQQGAPRPANVHDNAEDKRPDGGENLTLDGEDGKSRNVGHFYTDPATGKILAWVQGEKGPRRFDSRADLVRFVGSAEFLDAARSAVRWQQAPRPPRPEPPPVQPQPVPPIRTKCPPGTKCF